MQVGTSERGRPAEAKRTKPWLEARYEFLQFAISVSIVWCSLQSTFLLCADMCLPSCETLAHRTIPNFSRTPRRFEKHWETWVEVYEMKKEKVLCKLHLPLAHPHALSHINGRIPHPPNGTPIWMISHHWGRSHLIPMEHCRKPSQIYSERWSTTQEVRTRSKRCSNEVQRMVRPGWWPILWDTFIAEFLSVNAPAFGTFTS